MCGAKLLYEKVWAVSLPNLLLGKVLIIFCLEWKELADSALTIEDRKKIWNGLDYYFVLGTFQEILRGGLFK